MPVAPNPVVDKQMLAKELRRLREEHGLTQQEVAEGLKWPREKVGRIETAATSVSAADLRRLLDRYDIADEEEIAEFERRAASAQRPGWNEYKGLLRGRYMTYLGFEEVATVMRQYHLSLIPGLLQTRAYMREILTNVSEISPRDVRRLIEARTRRQELLTAEVRPTFKIIIDEAVLRLAGRRKSPLAGAAGAPPQEQPARRCQPDAAPVQRRPPSRPEGRLQPADVRRRPLR